MRKLSFTIIKDFRFQRKTSLFSYCLFFFLIFFHAIYRKLIDQSQPFYYRWLNIFYDQFCARIISETIDIIMKFSQNLDHRFYLCLLFLFYASNAISWSSSVSKYWVQIWIKFFVCFGLYHFISLYSVKTYITKVVVNRNIFPMKNKNMGFLI